MAGARAGIFKCCRDGKGVKDILAYEKGYFKGQHIQRALHRCYGTVKWSKDQVRGRRAELESIPQSDRMLTTFSSLFPDYHVLVAMP